MPVIDSCHRLRALLGALVAGTITAAPCAAGDTSVARNYAVWGLGHASCNQFAQAHEANDIHDFQTYLGGYLTAYATFAGPDSPQPHGPLTEHLHRIYDYCIAHRMDSFERAIQADVAASAATSASKGPASTWGRPPAPPAPSPP